TDERVAFSGLILIDLINLKERLPLTALVRRFATHPWPIHVRQAIRCFRRTFRPCGRLSRQSRTAGGHTISENRVTASRFSPERIDRTGGERTAPSAGRAAPAKR